MSDQVCCDTLARLWSMRAGPLALLPVELLHELLRLMDFVPRKIWTHSYGPDTSAERFFTLRWAVVHLDGSAPDARGGVLFVAQLPPKHIDRVLFKIWDLAHMDKAYALAEGPIHSMFFGPTVSLVNRSRLSWRVVEHKWLEHCDAFVKAFRHTPAFVAWEHSCYDTFLGVGNW
jgi:hypothetical protein